MIKYERIITDEEQKYLAHDLLDIKEWIDKAIEGKINNCMKRAAIQYRESLKTNLSSMIPANDKTAALTLINSKEYKNRVQRENDSIQINTNTRA
jgi:hypothetical protein